MGDICRLHRTYFLGLCCCFLAEAVPAWCGSHAGSVTVYGREPGAAWNKRERGKESGQGDTVQQGARPPGAVTPAKKRTGVFWDVRHLGRVCKALTACSISPPPGTGFGDMGKLWRFPTLLHESIQEGQPAWLATSLTLVMLVGVWDGVLDLRRTVTSSFAPGDSAIVGA